MFSGGTWLMDGNIIPYDPYHPHLGYTLIISLLAWLITTLYCRVALQDRPNQRIALAALVIGLPMYAELIAYSIEHMRPPPESQVGYLLTHLHAEVIQRYPIDTFLSPTATDLLIGGLGGLVLISLVRFLLGAHRLNSMLRRTVPIERTPYARALTRFLAVSGAQRASVPPVLVSDAQLPIAFASGIRRPRIYLSAGLLALLSDDELLAVLCHEWAHVQRRDTLWMFLIRLQRDMLWFVPSSHLAWQNILRSQDEACDQMAATLTGQPLTLARALVKLAAVRPAARQPALIAAHPFMLLGAPPRRRVLQMIRLHAQAPGQRKLVAWTTGLLACTLLVLASLPALLGS